MNPKRIEAGDEVRVDFNTSRTVCGVVDYIPVASGDSWIIIDNDSKNPVYVNMFECMVLLKKNSDEYLPF